MQFLSNRIMFLLHQRFDFRCFAIGLKNHVHFLDGTFNTKPEQNGWHFANDILTVFFNWRFWYFNWWNFTDCSLGSNWQNSTDSAIKQSSVLVMAHYLNQCWLNENWTLRNNLEWNLNQSKKLFFRKLHLEMALKIGLHVFKLPPKQFHKIF